MNYSDIGSAYIGLKKYKEAFPYLLLGVHYIVDSLKDTLTDPFANLGECYQHVGKFDSALYCYQKSLHIASIMDNVEGKLIILSNLGDLFLKQHKIYEAESYLKQAYDIAKQISSNTGLLGATTNLAELYAYKKDYKKAYDFEVKAYAANDSLLNAEKEHSTAEMQAKFDVKELDAQNKLLHSQTDIDTIKLKQKDILIYFSLGTVLLLIIIAWQIVRQNKLKTNQRLLQLEQKQLLAQMNPHFIFNCLNSIQQYIVQNDAENANKYLADFALLMRQTLDNSKDGIIPIKREIEYLENYLSLEGMRFENKFTYSISCANGINVNTLEIPSMIIQPFVENAIHHGLRNLEDKEGILKISFYIKTDYLFCEVEDNGIGIEESQKLKENSFIKYQSHGMELTKQRLALVSKINSTEYQISITNKTGVSSKSEGTIITIKFPIKA